MKSEDENRDSLHCFIVTFDLLFFPNTFCVSMYYSLNQYICFYLSNNKVVLQSESFLKLWVIFCCIQLLIFKVYRRANGCCHVTAYASRWHVNNRNWCVFSLPWMQLYADRIDFYASGLHNMGCFFCFFCFVFFCFVFSHNSYCQETFKITTSFFMGLLAFCFLDSPEKCQCM